MPAHFPRSVGRIAFIHMAGVACCLAVAVGLLWAEAAMAAEQIVIPGPPGSASFGKSVTVLPNGNYVVLDPAFEAEKGAVLLFDGRTRVLISMLTGARPGDQVGSGGVYVLSNGNFVIASPNASLFNPGSIPTPIDDAVYPEVGMVTWGSGAIGVTGELNNTNSLIGTRTHDHVSSGGIVTLTNGNFVVISPDWDSNSAINAGAVTWGNGATGIAGVVTTTNSLVGSTLGDHVGSGGVTALPGGNYVVLSPDWDLGAAANAGAITWGSGDTGIAGAVATSNSLVGSKANCKVGSGGIMRLANGNYVVASPAWDADYAGDAGAATWASSAAPLVGYVSPANSLIGSKADDAVAGGGVTALSNGNYVVLSPNWTNGTATGAGAATWGSGTTGVSGEVTSLNSLVGSKTGDHVASGGAQALTSGNYVVVSPNWVNGAIANAGAVTWGNGILGSKGAVSPGNSLIGGRAGDLVGAEGVTALANGNYVVASAGWDNGIFVDAGAVTWGSGATGISGTVAITNSLVGSGAYDGMGGSGVTALGNGNFVVSSPMWDNGAVANAGAVTWGNGAIGAAGTVSSTNSLVGASAEDRAGSGGITSLTNGNYVVRSPRWNNGATLQVGAVTWGSGAAGIAGAIAPANSLVGSTADDQLGNAAAIPLVTGNYVIASPLWDNGSILNAGAVTWGDGWSAISGNVTSSNSLVGSALGDQVGSGPLTALSDGNYMVVSPHWTNSGLFDAGAVTLGSRIGGTAGPLAPANSVWGGTALGGSHMAPAYDPVHEALVVGLPDENRVGILGPSLATMVDLATSPNPSAAGKDITLSAYVLTFPEGEKVPSGVVTFTVDGANVGTAELDWRGKAYVTVRGLAVGTHTAAAAYDGGTSGFSPSIAKAVSHYVILAPVPARDQATTVQGRAVEMAVLANDEDASGTGLFVAGVGQPAHGSVVIANGAQSVIYTPNPGFVGEDKFTYTVQDGAGRQAVGEATVTVTPSDDPDQPPDGPGAPAQATTLTFTDTKGLVTLLVPAGVYTGALSAEDRFDIVYTSILSPTSNVSQKPFNLTHAGFTFQLEAYLNSARLTTFQAARPMTLTIAYDASLLTGLKEETLSMYSWTGVSWHPWGTTLVNRDTANHTITFQLTRLGEFALFAGSRETQLCLPLVIRSTRAAAAEAPGQSATLPAGATLELAEDTVRLYLPEITNEHEK